MDENNQYVRPVMIHRAIYGSLERFFALVIEHYEGVYPLWLSPRQVIIIPIYNKFDEYCRRIYDKLREIKVFVDIDLSDNTFNKKMAMASTLENKYNYIVIVGDNEVKNENVSVKDIKGKKFVEKLDDFVIMVKKEIEEYQ